MNKISFDQVEHMIQKRWLGSAEHFFHEIAWDCLDQAGYTQYDDVRTDALIHVYPYVIQMLCDEFFYRAYDETCDYEYEVFGDKPLTDAAIRWLWRDVLGDQKSGKSDEYFSSSAHDMLRELVFALRRTVAGVIFDQLGEHLTGMLLYFAAKGEPLEELDADELPVPFQTKDELLTYCKNLDISLPEILDLLPAGNAVRTWDWIENHSCASGD